MAFWRRWRRTVSFGDWDWWWSWEVGVDMVWIELRLIREIDCAGVGVIPCRILMLDP
jgi:hypothetical protein